MKNIYVRGTIALLAGMAINFFGDWLLGVKIEIFNGISTFNFLWMMDVFFVPFICGLAVAGIFGYGGKWLACLPPLFVRAISYTHLYFSGDRSHDFFYDLHIFYWGLCVILAVEASNLGGILGEVLKGAYGGKGVKHVSVKQRSSNERNAQP